MRYVVILFLSGFCAAQSLSPASPIGSLSLDSTGTYVAQASSVTKLNQWTAAVPFAVLGLNVMASGTLVAAGAGSVASLDPATGRILSSSSFTTPASIQHIVVTRSGNMIVSGGASGVAVTAGALNIPNEQGFLMKLDPSGKVLWIASGISGAVTTDSAENIYVAGNDVQAKFPTTPHAYQATATFSVCGSSGGAVGFVTPCAQQYIAKVSADGSTLLFATYLTGSLGANPQAIALAPDGSIYTAGSGQSTDYPVTAGALIGTDPAKLVDSRCNCITSIVAYSSSGFLSRLSPDGTQLLYSTYLGGSQTDSASSLAVGADGSIVIGGIAGSPDFPGLPVQLDNCRPQKSLVTQKQRDFLMQISPDGSKITTAQLVGGTNPSTGIACITDAADNTFADTVSPGELITINGIGVGPTTAETPGFGAPAVQIGGVSVTFDGIPAVLTAAGGTIVTAGVPFAVAGKLQTTVTLLQNGQPFDSKVLSVASANPSMFLLPANGKSCNAPPIIQFGALTGASPTPAPLILNADGTINACDNPASAGSAVTLFMNGLGAGVPQLTVASGQLTVNAVSPMEGTTSVEALSVQLPKGLSNPFYFTVTEGSTQGRDAIPLYVKP
jgi:uncharacterized protein (TIGR03437 family)